MNPLALSEEQAMYRDMVRRFFHETVTETNFGRGAIEADHWHQLATLGVVAALLPENAGGLGGGPREIAVIGEECGRALAITPLAECVIGAMGLLSRCANRALVDRFASAVLEGRETIAWAAGTAKAGPDDLLHGEMPLACWAGQASILVVRAAHGAVLVDPAADGVVLEQRSLIDGTPAATVTLNGAKAQQLAIPEDATEQSAALAQLFHVAEMVGAMALMHRAATQYAQQREQFGHPIATFQAVQHKLARMFIWLEQSRSMLLKASTGDPASPEFGRSVMSAKVYVSDAAQRLAEEAVQLHGGIGITEELVVGRGLRRITVLARLPCGAEVVPTSSAWH